MLKHQDEIKEEYTRVTTFLYPFSGLSVVPHYILDAARERGTIVDRITQAILDDIGVPYYDEKFQGYIHSFDRWREGKTFLPRPDRFYCHDHMITGEIDRIYEDTDGKLVLIDIKTPANESNTWQSQASAYSYLCKLGGYDISRIEFIQLRQNGDEPKICHYTEDFESFLDDVRIYNKYFRNKKNDQRDLEWI